MNKDTTSVYTFSHYDTYSGVNTSLTFTCPSDPTTDFFAYMSSRAAAAFGYMEKNIDNYFHYTDDAFTEFDGEDCTCNCDCECCE